MDALEISPNFIAFSITFLYLIFFIAWNLDSRTHGELVAKDISDQELITHRLILIPSILMEISLITMFWFRMESLPFFLGFYFVRTVHEFIDELRFHSKRCSARESYYHLVMWCSVHIKTLLLFYWAFFMKYEGIELISPVYYIVFAILNLGLGKIAITEFKR